MKKECSLIKQSFKNIFKTVPKSEIKTNKNKVSGTMKPLIKLIKKLNKDKNLLENNKCKKNKLINPPINKVMLTFSTSLKL